MNDLTWEYQCLFGFKHRWTTIVGNVRMVVEQVSGHTSDWIAYDKDSWEMIFKKFSGNTTRRMRLHKLQWRVQNCG